MNLRRGLQRRNTSGEALAELSSFGMSGGDLLGCAESGAEPGQTDDWAHCVAACRTNAAALQHMNRYSSSHHFCFAPPPPPPAVVPRSAYRGESCTAACARASMTCEPTHFPVINNCATLRKHFRCVGCEVNGGFDQPAWVALDAPSGSMPGHCLFNTDSAFFSCDGKHALTVRLCPCVPA